MRGGGSMGMLFLIDHPTVFNKRTGTLPVAYLRSPKGAGHGGGGK